MVVRWLKQDWETRRTHALCLLQDIRLGLVPEDRLKKLMDASILDIPECNELLQKVIKELKSDNSTTERAIRYPSLFHKRGTISVSTWN